MLIVLIVQTKACNKMSLIPCSKKSAFMGFPQKSLLILNWPYVVFYCEMYSSINSLMCRHCKETWRRAWSKRNENFADPQEERVWNSRKANSGGNKLFVTGFVKASKQSCLPLWCWIWTSTTKETSEVCIVIVRCSQQIFLVRRE
jgi:hypothetical protein